MNLAAFRYRAILAEDGGPIARIGLTDLLILGQRQFQANASLRPELIAWRVGGEVFSNDAGSGTAVSPMVARHKAISEALERWAQMAVQSNGARHRFGFDLDPSSNGMAAFPGWRATEARRAALEEAAERFSLLSWWEGRLAAREADTPWPGVRAVVIDSPAPGVTVILHRRAPRGHLAYGHAAGRDFSAACLKAAPELERHDLAVRHFALTHAGRGADALSPGAHAIERRSLYFATPEGHADFLARVRHRPAATVTLPPPAFDGPIPGPWTRYAQVWRTVFPPPSLRFLGDDPRYFFW